MRNHKRRRAILLLVIALALLGWLVWGMVGDLSSRPLSYHIQYAQPVNPYLCPGDSLRYEVQVEVAQVPTALSIVKSWCEAKPSGICSQATTREYRLGILRPRQVYTLASRIVPDTDFFKPGGHYEFWHTTTATTNSGVTVEGYVVGEIVMRDNCEIGGNDGTD